MDEKETGTILWSGGEVRKTSSPSKMNNQDIDPKEKGAEFWYEAYLKQKQENEELAAKLDAVEKELAELKEKLNKLQGRTSENSSQPPSQDGYKKKNKALRTKVKRKKGPKYGHEGKTRNGFGQVDNWLEINVETCPVCSAVVEKVESAPIRRVQIAELVSKPVEVNEYQRPLYRCPDCGWQGYGDLPLGCREDFSYGALLTSLVGWLGYGGHLSWAKQRYLIETIFGIPMSQGSLCKMHQWFCESLYPSYEKWWELIQQPGVRCVDETSYRLNGTNYWIWVATSPSVCVLFFAPTRSGDEVKSLLGENFAGILSSDCWSAYGVQSAGEKQKCWAHIERELKSLETSHLPANRQFAQQIFPILHDARSAYKDFHDGKISLEQLREQRSVVEARLAQVLDHPPPKGWDADSQNLAQRFRKYWQDWFTFLGHPEVKPDNNDAERALRPVVVHRKVSGGVRKIVPDNLGLTIYNVVVHRKVSGGVRSHWGAQLVAMMFSFLETMRLQGKNAVDELFYLLAC